MSLYSQYIKERENGHMIETEDGFITYFIYGKECHMKDIYIVPEKRRSGVALEFQRQIVEKVKPLGCTFLSGMVDIRLPSCTYSAKCMLNDNFKLAKIDGNVIYFIKDI
jgi:hypothetical protein